MKKIYSQGLVLSLLFCFIIVPQYQSTAQCVNQGTIADPACGGTTTQPNVGNGQEWDLLTTNGADYSVSISAGSSACGGGYTLSTTSFTGNGGTQTEDVLSGGVCCWAAGATSASLTYTKIQYVNTTSNANMCQGSTRALTLNATPLTFGAWSITGGTGTGTISGSTLTAGNAGTVIVAYEQGGCTSNSITITIDPSVSVTSAPAGGALCENATFTYTGSPAGGTWSVTGNGSINGGSGLFTPSSITAPTASQSSIITYTKGTCDITSDLTVYATPSTATVGATQDLCGTLTTSPLGGNTPVVGSGSWSETSGPGTSSFSNSASGSSTATASTQGNYGYTWTITNGTCPSSSATIDVSLFNYPTPAIVGATQNICGLTSGPLGGNTPTSGTGAWSQVSGPGTTFFSSSTMGSSTASVSSAGTYVFAWTITNGTCTSADSVTVNYYASPTTATAGATQNICGSLTSASLGGNTAAIGTGIWTQTSGPGTSVFSNSASGSSTATASIPGSYTYTWTISNGTCAPSSASTVVNFVATPGGGTIANASYCASVGSTSVSVTGVTNANEYQWALPAGLSGSSGTSTITVGGTIPGMYTVTVTPVDTAFGLSCSGSPITGTVTILSLPVIDSVNTGHFGCYLGSTDSIFIYATTLNGNLSYSINGGSSYPNTSGIFTGITPGNYSVYVKDDSSCSVAYALNPVTVATPPTVLTLASVKTPVGCHGDSAGSIELLASGGGGGYIYQWSTGQNIQIISGLPAGTYTCSVTDSRGCTLTLTDSLINPPVILDTITKIDVTCYGAGNGKAFLTVSGGEPPYRILWDNFDTTYDIAHLSGGVYRVQITDTFGCVHSDSVRIKRPPLLTAPMTVSGIKCFGTNLDTVMITAAGGNPGGYNYSWSPSVSSSDMATGLAPGQYIITISDVKGCSVVDTANISQPLSAISAASVTTPVGCAGDSNGSINLLASGGVGGYTYSWSSGQSIQIISGLGAGTYTGSATDANGCVATVTDILQNPPSLSSSIAATNVSCNGYSNGTLALNVTGGVQPYNVLWSNDDTSYSITGVPAGQYGVVITDSYGCKQIDTVSITQPTALMANVAVVNIGCNGGNTGSVTVTVTGGTPGVGGYIYSWATPVLSTTDSAAGLSAGTYTVTASDSLGCSVTASGTVTQPSSGLSAAAIVNQVTCNNDSNGSITILASGGSGGYTYLWSNGDTSAYINNLSSATYTATVTDGTGCQAIYTDSISNPSPIMDMITGTNLTCATSATGSATVAASGGTPGYTYLWSDFETTSSISGLGAGTYRVIITDSNACQHHDSIVITSPAPLSAVVTVVNNACNGANAGSVTATVTGGTPGIGGYIYSWAAPVLSTTDSAAGLAAGTYSLTVSDSLGCSITASGTVTQPLSPITLTQQVTPVICSSDSNGSIIITLVTGGGGGYAYNWSTGQTTPAITGLPAGSYTVSVTDANGCVATLSDTLTNPAPITDVLTGTNVGPCYGDHNGTVTVIAAGGVSPLTLLWSEGDTTATITHLTGDRTYAVTITDANGCMRDDSIRITRPSRLKDTISVSNVICAGSNIDTLSVSASGSYASGGYTYTWSPNVTSGPLVTGVAPGTYYLTVTDTAGCTSTDSAVITQPANILTVSSQVNQITCNNLNNGSILILASGGVGTYLYSWSSSSDTTQLISSLPAGIYTGSVTDGNGCVKSITDTIVNPSPITDTIAGVNVTCAGTHNGSITMTVGGGTPGYTFLWSNFATTQNLDSIGGGLYRVIITDAHGCQHDDSIIITEPQPLNATVTVRDIACHGGNDGAVIVTVTGGTPGLAGYTYAWSPIASTTDSVSGVGPNTYDVTITDANACNITASGTVTQPSTAVSVLSSVVDVLCGGNSNGSIDLAVNGGTPGYTYIWSGGQQTQNIGGLGAGIDTVTVTDANGCLVVVSDTVKAPSPITDSISGTNVTCAGVNNGSITLSVNGGSLPYSFLWSNFSGSQNLDSIPGGYYYVIITDANGCQKRDSIDITEPQPLTLTDSIVPIGCAGASNGAIYITATGGTGAYSYAWTPSEPNSASISGLGAGNYSVIVTDANHCAAHLSADLVDPAVLSVTYVVTPPSCNGYNNGSITISANGGSPGYSYAWTGTSGGAVVTNLSAGTYDVTVTDSHGCSVGDTIVMNQPGPMYVSGIQKNVSCHDLNDGQILPTGYGGTLPYSYQWYLGSDTFAPLGPITQDIIQLAGGNYYLVITDANGCEATFSRTIINPDTLIVNLSDSNLKCAGNNRGYVLASVTGGTVPYQYLWNNFTTDSFQAGIPAGSYAVVVTDSNGCHQNQSIDVTQPSPIGITPQATNPSCSYSSDGKIVANVQGGTGAYAYSWNTAPIQTTDSATGLAGGSYILVVTDANSCVQADTFSLTAPPALVVNTAIINPVCSGGTTGEIALSVTGGSEPYIYNWNTSPAQASHIASLLSAGTYIATITDSKGCNLFDTATLVAPQPVTVTLAQGTTSCAGAADGTIIVNATGGLPPYLYTVGAVTQSGDTFTNMAVGSYSVEVSDVNGCEGYIPFVINPRGTLTDSLIASPDVILAGQTVQLSAMATSDSGIASYMWYPSDSLNFGSYTNGSANADSVTAMPTQTQDYTVVVTDSGGCSVTSTVRIYVSAQPDIFVPSAFTPNNNGLNDYFQFAILGATTVNVQIWNNLGNEVYSNPAQPNGIGGNNGWDGTYHGQVVQFGTYTYQLVVTYFDGHTQTLSGTVVVMQ